MKSFEVPTLTATSVRKYPVKVKVKEQIGLILHCIALHKSKDTSNTLIGLHLLGYLLVEQPLAQNFCYGTASFFLFLKNYKVYIFVCSSVCAEVVWVCVKVSVCASIVKLSVCRVSKGGKVFKGC